jgi:hypothetical protein
MRKQVKSAVLSLELEVPEAKLLEAFRSLTLQQRMRLLEMLQDSPFAYSPFIKLVGGKFK